MSTFNGVSTRMYKPNNLFFGGSRLVSRATQVLRALLPAAPWLPMRLFGTESKTTL